MPYGNFFNSPKKSIPKEVINVQVDSAVRVIEQRALSQCSQLTNVQINEGPKEIRESAFADCKSLLCIIIPSLSILFSKGSLVVARC